MKMQTGIVRCVDELGRFVLPIELRRAMEIREGDRVGISVEGEEIRIDAKPEARADLIKRSVDLLGRVVIPMEIRKRMGIDIKDQLEVFTDGGVIYLRKYIPGCVFCGEASGAVDFKGKKICPACARAAAELTAGK